MKNLKKTTALILSLAMVLTLFAVPVMADAHEMTAAEQLETLGVLQGSGDGVTEEYLAEGADRLRAAALYLKLLGLEAEAEAYQSEDNFNDATAELSNYTRNVMAYLKANPSLGFIGDENGNFNPFDTMTAQSFYKVMLTALGYEQDTDFTWSETLMFAKLESGLEAIADKTDLTIGDFATATVETLNAEVKDTGMTMIEKLVNDGIVAGQDAKDAGWADVVDPEIVSLTDPEDIEAEWGGEVPALPETVTATYDDETEVDLVVTWSQDDIDAIDTSAAGTYAVEGTVEETEMTATVNVVVVEPDLEVASVEATDLDEITVSFNKPVEDTTDVSFQVKRGAAIYSSTATWNDDKDEVALTTIVNLPPNDYTVEITGIADDVVVEDVTFTAETATSLEILTTTVQLVDNADIDYIVRNQYGDEMSTPVTLNSLDAKSVYNVTQGFSEPTTNVAGTSVIRLATLKTGAGGNNTAAEDQLRVTLTYKGMTAQATVTVIAESALEAFSLGNVEYLSGKNRVNVSDAKDGNANTIELNYTMTDQYGAEKTLTASSVTAAAIETADGIQLVSSDNTVISGFSTNASNELILDIAGSGTATITSIVNATGQISQTTVTVEPDPYASSAVISAPTQLIAGNDAAFDLDVVMTDQYGDVYDPGVVLATPSSDGTAATAVISADGTTLTITPTAGVTASTAVTISINNAAGTTIGSVSFTVEPDAEIAYISSVDFGKLFEVGATATLVASDINAIDQYGRSISVSSFTIADGDGAPSLFGIVGGTITAPGTAQTEVLTITETDSILANRKTYNITVKSIASTGITSYELKDFGTVFASANTSYHAAPELTGKDANGDTVNLLANKIDTLISNDTSIAKITGGNVEGVAVGTTTIKAYDGATLLASSTVTVTTDAAVLETASFSATTIVGGANFAAGVNLTSIMTLTDQYGVTVASGSPANATISVASSHPAIINSDGDVVTTGGAGTTVDVVVTTANGIQVTDTITVN